LTKYICDAEMCKKLLLKIVSVILGLLCAAAISGIGGEDAAAGKFFGPHADVTRLEKKIHDMANREREKRGLPLLLWNKRLHRIARNHSQDMAERDFFSHEDAEGRGFCDRYQAAGFECRIRVGDVICRGAENISQLDLRNSSFFKDGRLILDRETEDKIAESVVRRWMDSKGHRANILTPYFKRQAIGAAVSGDGKVYITEDFC
jgi:uncharacterized protein YkwD